MSKYRPTAVERRAEKQLASILAARAAHRHASRSVNFAELLHTDSALDQARDASDLLSNHAHILRHLSRGSINVAGNVAVLLFPRMYCWERNESRWPDGLFHLVDRVYQPIHDVALSREELDKLGWLAWHDTRWRQVGVDDSDDVVCITDGDFAQTCTPQGLQFLADLLTDTADYIAAAAKAINAAKTGGAA